MIIRTSHLLLTLAVAGSLTACSDPPGNAPAGNADASAAKPVAAAPTAAALLALEKKASEAYINGDGRFFEDMLSDQFVMQLDGVRISKTDLVKMISGIKCEAKQGWALTEPQILEIDDDAYVLSYVSDMEGSCTADGKTEHMPSPVRAATVWIRNGEQWQAVFHGENQIVDLTALQATDKQETATQDGGPVTDANTATTSTPAKPTTDAITDALMSAENILWDAWKEKDANKIEVLTAKDIAFVDLFGTYSATKADTLKVWTGPTCDVTSFKLTDGVGTSVSPSVGILTLAGTVNGSCGGQDISGQKIYGNTVYVRDGDSWKWAFGFNSPS